jgi:hypothetical protein
MAGWCRKRQGQWSNPISVDVDELLSCRAHSSVHGYNPQRVKQRPNGPTAHDARPVAQASFYNENELGPAPIIYYLMKSFSWR